MSSTSGIDNINAEDLNLSVHQHEGRRNRVTMKIKLPGDQYEAIANWAKGMQASQGNNSQTVQFDDIIKAALFVGIRTMSEEVEEAARRFMEQQQAQQAATSGSVEVIDG